LAAVLGERAGGRGSRDPASDDEDVGLLHQLLLCRYCTQCIILHRRPVRKRLPQTFIVYLLILHDGFLSNRSVHNLRVGPFARLSKVLADVR